MIYTILTYVCLFGFLIYDCLNKKLILTPIKVFNIMWILILYMYSFNLSYIQQTFSERTSLIFLVSILAFDITCFIMDFIKIRVSSIKEKDNEKSSENCLNNRIVIVNYIFIICFVIELIYSKGLPLFWLLTGDSRTYLDFGIPSFHGILNGLAMCMGAYLIFQKKNKSKYIYIIYGLLIVSRQILMTMFIEAMVFKILTSIRNKEKINYRKYIVIAVIILFIFTFIGSFRSSGVMQENFQPREEYQDLPENIMWIYSYTMFSFSNFNNLVSITDGGINGGGSLLKAFVPSILDNLLNLSNVYNPYFLVSSCFTVSTYFPELYLDFGVTGIAIFNIIIAVLGTVIYKTLRETNTIKNRLLYAIYIHNIIFLGFNNMFIYLPIIAQIIFALIIFKGFDNSEEYSK